MKNGVVQGQTKVSTREFNKAQLNWLELRPWAHGLNTTPSADAYTSRLPVGRAPTLTTATILLKGPPLPAQPLLATRKRRTLNALGSVTSLSNASGSIARTYTFDSFGNQNAFSASLNNPFRYTGREFAPETSFYLRRTRYYDASQIGLSFWQGRWGSNPTPSPKC